MRLDINLLLLILEAVGAVFGRATYSNEGGPVGGQLFSCNRKMAVLHVGYLESHCRRLQRRCR